MDMSKNSKNVNFPKKKPPEANVHSAARSFLRILAPYEILPQKLKNDICEILTEKIWSKSKKYET